MSLRGWLDRRGRRAADAALGQAFPDLDRAERARIMRACRRIQTRIAGDARRADSPRDFCRRLHHQGWQHLHAAARPDRGLILLSAPVGSWAAALRAMELYRPRLATTTVDPPPAATADPRPGRDEPVDEPARIAALTAGEEVAVVIHPVADETGPWHFLGRSVRASEQVARLALAAHAPILPVFALPEANRCYRLVLRQAIVGDGEADDPAAIGELMARCLAAIEDVVREHPSLWPWMSGSETGTENRPQMTKSAR